MLEPSLIFSVSTLQTFEFTTYSFDIKFVQSLISVEGRYTVGTSRGMVGLTIENVRRGDAGNWTCSFESGQDAEPGVNSTIQLIVLGMHGSFVILCDNKGHG